MYVLWSSASTCVHHHCGSRCVRSQPVTKNTDDCGSTTVASILTSLLLKVEEGEEGGGIEAEGVERGEEEDEEEVEEGMDRIRKPEVDVRVSADDDLLGCLCSSSSPVT